MQNQEDKLLGKIVGYTDEEGHRQKPIYEMTKEIKVKIFDWQPIVDSLKTGEHKDSNLSIRCGNGIIFVGEEKIPVLIDTECCGIESDEKTILFEGRTITGRFMEGVGVFNKVKNGIPMFPIHYVDIPYSEIEKHFTGGEMELWDFMGSRYEYNPRIHSNLRGIVKLYKGKDLRSVVKTIFNGEKK